MMRTPVKVLGFNSLVKWCKFEAGWEKMQKNMILEIPKGKWDLKNATVQSVAGGKFAVLPKPKRHGVIQKPGHRFRGVRSVPCLIFEIAFFK